MSIQSKIRVNTHYTRSINLERDADSSAVVDAYIPTTRALRTLKGMAVALKAQVSPRAWSLVGPYGSGKSSLAVFLAHLLSSPEEPSTEAALKKLDGTDRDLGATYRDLTRGNAGYCTVLLTGSPESFGRRLVQALAEKAKASLHGRCKIIQELVELTERKEPPTSSEIIDAVKSLQDALASKYSGLLIVVDELGKFLEYEARHYGANDIFLLQALAEHALADHAVKLSLVVMLHQAFEQYARGLGESLKNEWAKVQGRFESIPFLESAEQTLRIVAAAIEPEFSNSEASKIQQMASQMAKTLHKAKAIPGTMDEATAADLFARCYPLHPVSALLLPILCQKVAQNERTLFSYLGSRETHGFLDGLSRCEQVGEWIYPWEIYEYFILNQSAALTDHFTHRRWAEVVTALERLGDAAPEQAQLLKTIGLLNIVGAQGGFKASQEVVNLCQPDQLQVASVVEDLKKRAVLQFRKFSSEYRVWQGSDFDIDAALEEERGKLKNIKLAETLNERHSISPVVARKYSIENGALRYFLPSFADSDNYRSIGKESADARIIFYLAEQKNDAELFHTVVRRLYSKRDITVLCFNGEQLRENVTEVLALEQVQRSSPELNSDPVAQREFKDRYNTAIRNEEEMLGRVMDEPELSHWFALGERLPISGRRALQEELSNVLESVYSKSPRIRNELINRNQPSAQANAAKNKLAIAMFKHAEKADLGIEKFPPEKAIYRATLRETRLHVRGPGGLWRFQGPTKANDPCNVLPVWQRIEVFLDSTEQRPRSLIELNKELMAPPYGIKEGMLPILYLASLMANQQELAIFEGKVYTPCFAEEQVERFLKRPDEFTVQKFIVDDEALQIYSIYSPVLTGQANHQGMLAVAHFISSLVNALPPFAKSTLSGISKEAVMVRDAILSNGDLRELLLFTLPSILVGNGTNIVCSDSKEIRGFQYDLSHVFEELTNFTEKVKVDLSAKIAWEFGYRDDLTLPQLRLELRRFAGLHSLAGKGNEACLFLYKLKDEVNDIDAWIEGILSFIAQRPLSVWSDDVLTAVQKKIEDLTAKVLALEARYFGDLPASYNDDSTNVFVLELITRDYLPFSRTVVVKESMRTEIDALKNELLGIFVKGKDDDERLATLAEIVRELPTKTIKDSHELV